MAQRASIGGGMNLEEYALKNTRKNCPVCGFSEQAQVEAAWNKGIKAKVIASWLIEEMDQKADTGLDRKIRYHFDQRHPSAGVPLGT